MTNKCLTTGCNNLNAPILKRGICMACYSKAKKMVESGTTTWEELASLGLVSAESEKPVDPFTEAFKKAKEEKTWKHQH